MGDGEAAQRLARQVVEGQRRLHGADSVEAVEALANLAGMLADASRFAEAEALLREGDARLARAGAAQSPQAVELETNLADTLALVSHPDEAETRFRQVLAKSRAVLGSKHVYTAEILIKYGFLLSNLGRLRESDELLAEAAAILQPIGHYDYGAAIRYLGYNALAAERFPEAMARFSEAERFFRATLGDDNAMTWAAVLSKAAAEMRTGQLATAERHQRQAIAAIDRLYGPESNDARTPLVQLGETLRREGRVAEALAAHERALAMATKLFGARETLASAVTRLQLAEDHVAAASAGDLAQARQLADTSLAYFRAGSASPSRLARALLTSAHVAIAAGDRERARRELDEAIPLFAATLPAGAPTLVEARQARRRLGRG